MSRYITWSLKIYCFRTYTFCFFNFVCTYRLFLVKSHDSCYTLNIFLLTVSLFAAGTLCLLTYKLSFFFFFFPLKKKKTFLLFSSFSPNYFAWWQNLTDIKFLRTFFQTVLFCYYQSLSLLLLLSTIFYSNFTTQITYFFLSFFPPHKFKIIH